MHDTEEEETVSLKEKRRYLSVLKQLGGSYGEYIFLQAQRTIKPSVP